MSRITISTALSVTYKAREDAVEPLCEQLDHMVKRAAEDGYFTGEAVAEVVDYRYDVRQLREIDHDQLVAWLTEQVESGALPIEDLVSKIATYGAMDPAEFFEEMRERMGLKDAGDDGIISEDAFRDEWGASAQESGDLFEFEQVKNLPINTVWTVITGDGDGDDSWFAVPGFRRVNRMGYVVTTKPWDSEDLTAYWFKDDLEREEDEDEQDEG